MQNSSVQWREVQFIVYEHSAVQCSAVQCSAVQCSAVQCTVVWRSAVKFSAVKLSSVECVSECSVRMSDGPTREDDCVRSENIAHTLHSQSH